jgi:hypothetical protein
MEAILSNLNADARKWVESLPPETLSYILQRSYNEHIVGINGIVGMPSAIANSSQIVGLPNNSVEIGQIGEIKFKDITNKLSDSYSVRDTTKEGKRGDFIITYNHDGYTRKCIVDIKNYKGTIPKKEIDKFLEDVSYGNYDCGLIISYRSKFMGISDSIYIEDTNLPNAKIPIMYLSSDSPEIILQCVELIIARTIVKNPSIDINKIENHIEILNNSIEHSSMTRRVLSELLTSVTKTIHKCQENLTIHEGKIKQSVQEMAKCTKRIMIDNLRSVAPPKIQPRNDNLIEGPAVISILPNNTAAAVGSAVAPPIAETKSEVPPISANSVVAPPIAETKDDIAGSAASVPTIAETKDDIAGNAASVPPIVETKTQTAVVANTDGITLHPSLPPKHPVKKPRSLYMPDNLELKKMDSDIDDDKQDDKQDEEEEIDISDLMPSGQNGTLNLEYSDVEEPDEKSDGDGDGDTYDDEYINSICLKIRNNSDRPLVKKLLQLNWNTISEYTNHKEKIVEMAVEEICVLVVSKQNKTELHITGEIDSVKLFLNDSIIEYSDRGNVLKCLIDKQIVEYIETVVELENQ